VLGTVGGVLLFVALGTILLIFLRRKRRKQTISNKHNTNTRQQQQQQQQQNVETVTNEEYKKGGTVVLENNEMTMTRTHFTQTFTSPTYILTSTYQPRTSHSIHTFLSLSLSYLIYIHNTHLFIFISLFI
jgi:hypothetical protein